MSASDRQSRARDRKRAAGLVGVTDWVPEGQRDLYRSIAKMLREGGEASCWVSGEGLSVECAELVERRRQWRREREEQEAQEAAEHRAKYEADKPAYDTGEDIELLNVDLRPRTPEIDRAALELMQLALPGCATLALWELWNCAGDWYVTERERPGKTPVGVRLVARTPKACKLVVKLDGRKYPAYDKYRYKPATLKKVADGIWSGAPGCWIEDKELRQEVKDCLYMRP